MSRSSWAKRAIFAVVLADCVGIYFANRHLNQPWQEPAPGVSDEVAVEVEPRQAEPRTELFASNEAIATVAPARPVGDASLPAYMPLPPAVVDETPANVPTIAAPRRAVVFDLPKVARLERSKSASRRFVSAFTTDIAGPGAIEPALPQAAFGGVAPAADGPAPGAAGTGIEAGELGAVGTGLGISTESVTVPPVAESQQPEATAIELPPASEAPAAETDAGIASEG